MRFGCKFLSKAARRPEAQGFGQESAIAKPMNAERGEEGGPDEAVAFIAETVAELVKLARAPPARDARPSARDGAARGGRTAAARAASTSCRERARLRSRRNALRPCPPAAASARYHPHSIAARPANGVRACEPAGPFPCRPEWWRSLPGAASNSSLHCRKATRIGNTPRPFGVSRYS